MDGVKISVNKENKKEEKKKTSVKKQTLKNPDLKKQASSQTKSKSKKISPKKEGKGFFSILVSVILTALIVGGGIYFWQERDTEKHVNKISAQARESRMEFEKRLNNIKDKLLGTEKEKEKISSEYEKLKEKADLLKNAKLSFSDSELGLSFDYPAVFGEVKIAILEKATGTSFLGEFSDNDKLVFGGVSKDFESDATSSAINFLDTLGYYSKKDKYYFQTEGDGKSKDFEIQPAKIIGFKDGEALLLDKKSFINQDEFSIAKGEKYIDIGENAGALINLKGEKYPGLAFIDSDFGMMSLSDFEEMLKSIEVK